MHIQEHCSLLWIVDTRVARFMLHVFRCFVLASPRNAILCGWLAVVWLANIYAPFFVTPSAGYVHVQVLSEYCTRSYEIDENTSIWRSPTSNVGASSRRNFAKLLMNKEKKDG
jgi:hypothetical protein